MASSYTVVGGGIGGLVVARRLAKAGRRVTLLEASGRLGGTVASHIVGGIDLDAGAESFAARGGVVESLAREIGLGPELVAPSDAGAWLQPMHGPAVRLPATSILGIPATPLARDVIAVVGLGGALRAQLDALLPSLATAPSLTLGMLVRRRMGSAVLDKLVAPVAHGVHSVHPDALLADRAAPGLRAAVRHEGSLAAAVRSLREAAPPGSAVAGIRGGVHRLVTELVADLETYGVDVQLGRRVSSTAGLDGEVVLAAPLRPSGGRKVVLVTLVVEAPELDGAPRGTGVLVARGAAGIRARALTHSTAKWAWLRERAHGRHVLRLSYDDEPADLAAVALQDASALLGVQLPAPVDLARVEWTRSLEGAADVGESVAGTGLAGIVAQAEAKATELLA